MTNNAPKTSLTGRDVSVKTGGIMAKISFIVDTGSCFSGVSGLIDSFGIANLWHADKTKTTGAPLFETELLSPDGQPVQVGGGFRVTPDGCFADRDKTDVVVIGNRGKEYESIFREHRNGHRIIDLSGIGEAKDLNLDEVKYEGICW